MEKRKFNPSDVVRTIIGGPAMMIVSIESYERMGLSAPRMAPGDLATCQWFDYNNHIQEATFYTSLLEHKDDWAAK